jgi:hypothetical protein
VLSIFALTIIACHSKKNIVAPVAPPPPPPPPPPAAIAQTPVMGDACADQSFNGLNNLLSKNCTTSGCHDASMPRMNFTNYDNFVKFSKNGEVKQHVLVQKNMPPGNNLSQDELDQIKCWLAGPMLK